MPEAGAIAGQRQQSIAARSDRQSTEREREREVKMFGEWLSRMSPLFKKVQNCLVTFSDYPTKRIII